MISIDIATKPYPDDKQISWSWAQCTCQKLEILKDKELSSGQKLDDNPNVDVPQELLEALDENVDISVTPDNSQDINIKEDMSGKDEEAEPIV